MERIAKVDSAANVSAKLQHNVSIPADVLTSLLASVNDLKSSIHSLEGSVLRLQNENKSIMEELRFTKAELQSTKDDLMMFRENSGVKFPRFAELPIEIRRIIWRFACTAPQVHNLSKHGGSRSYVNLVMNTCTEAKAVGLALKLDYFLVSYQIGYTRSEIFGTIKNYVNLDVDTIWLTQNDTVMLFPEDIQWICGKCRINGSRRSDPCYVGCLSALGGMAPNSVRRVAIDFTKWVDPEDDVDEMGTWHICQRHGIKELLLVIGRIGLEWEKDISFVSPTQDPWLTYLYMTEDLKVAESKGCQILSGGRNRTWQELEATMVQKAEEFKVQRAKDREEAFSSGDVSAEEVDRFPWREWSLLRDVSQWKPPRIRFVEAMKDTHKWTLAPVEKPRAAR